MDFPISGNPGVSPLPEDLQNQFLDIDPKQIEKVRDILITFANAVSAMKIFPSDHASVKKFAGDLTVKILNFLETEKILEIGIEEYSFTYRGKYAFRDETSIKSLPFFFFKDGLQVLIFDQGVGQAEILEFLELIKKEAQKPPDEGDIVNALWEKNLTGIKYFAPDDFLELKILEEQSDLAGNAIASALPADLADRILDYDIDLSKLTSGKIELTADDKKEPPDPGIDREKAPKEDSAHHFAGGSKAASIVDFDESEIQELNSIIHLNRTVSYEEEFLNLMIEMVYLLNDLSKVSGDLDTFYEFHLDQIQRGNFKTSVLMIKNLEDLKQSFAGTVPEKAALLDAFLKKVIQENTLRFMREFFEKESSVDYESFLELLRLLGRPALPLAADLYESTKSQEFRNRALDYFWDIGMKDPGTLIEQADDSRPSLSREIISVLRQNPDKKAVSCLAAFLRFSNRNLRLEAVRALGGISDEIANKILMGFLADSDESVRIEAANQMKFAAEDISRVQNVIKIISQPAFAKKCGPEKTAFFKLLGRSRTDEAFNFLHKALFKTFFFRSKRRRERRLGSVSGLESMATPPAQEALRRGASSRNKKVRDACLQALRRLSSAPAEPDQEERNR